MGLFSSIFGGGSTTTVHTTSSQETQVGVQVNPSVSVNVTPPAISVSPSITVEPPNLAPLQNVVDSLAREQRQSTVSQAQSTQALISTIAAGDAAQASAMGNAFEQLSGSIGSAFTQLTGAFRQQGESQAEAVGALAEGLGNLAEAGGGTSVDLGLDFEALGEKLRDWWQTGGGKKIALVAGAGAGLYLISRKAT